MSKPIFIVRFPSKNISFDDRKTLIEQTELVKNELTEYHVLPVLDPDALEVRFECFNAPHTEMEFEELKRRVLSLIESPNHSV